MSIKELEEFRNLLSFLKTKVRYFHDDINKLESLPFLILRRFLEISLLVNQKGELSGETPQIVDMLLKEVKSYLYDEFLEFVELIPITRFESNVDNIAIENRVTIRRMMNEERVDFLNQTKNYIFMDPQTYQYLIEVVQKVKKGDFGRMPPEPFEANRVTRKIITSLVTSLRLIAEGFVEYEFIFSAYRLKLMGFNGTLSRNLNIYYDQPFHFEQRILPKLKKLYNHIYPLEDEAKTSVITIVIDRFNYAYGRRTISDVVIDLAVAFEILFSKKKDGKDSITFKLGTRTSRLLGTNPEEREKIASHNF